MIPLPDIKTLYIDMDGVAINTIEAIVRMYDDDFSTYTDYKKIPWTEINTWDFTELKCASSEYINMYFNQKRFFDFVQPMDNFDEIVNRLKDRFSIKLCSMGYTPNLRRKELYIQEHYPFAEFIGVNFKSFPDKSHIDMSDGVIIDGENGFLSPQGDAKALAEKLKYVSCLDVSKRNSIRKSAINTALKFSDTCVSKKYLDDVLSWK